MATLLNRPWSPLWAFWQGIQLTYTWLPSTFSFKMGGSHCISSLVCVLFAEPQCYLGWKSMGYSMGRHWMVQAKAMPWRAQLGIGVLFSAGAWCSHVLLHTSTMANTLHCCAETGNLVFGDCPGILSTRNSKRLHWKSEDLHNVLKCLSQVSFALAML